MEDQRAHVRIDGLEKVLKDHFEDHRRFEKNLDDSTNLIRSISENVSELVDLIKGVKVGRKFIMWIAPVVAALMAAWAWFSGAPR